MSKKLLSFSLLVSLLLWFSIGSANQIDHDSSDIQKPKALPIPAGRIMPSSHPFIISGERSCLIQYDDDTVAYYFADFDTGWGFAVRMDPEDCKMENLYPFKITDVHFYLFDFRGADWPVEIRVNIRDLKTDTLYAQCDSPGVILYHQTFTIPIDSSYQRLGRPMSLSLDSLNTPTFSCCVDTSFFLEIVFTGGTSAPFPSLLMTDTPDSADTCHDWFLINGKYNEWYQAWAPPTPGNAVIRITGYTHSSDCNVCWHWMPPKTTAPSGMPDFDQNQFGDSSAMDVPTAAANCLWWFNKIPQGTTPPDLIRLLSSYFGTNPDSGTRVDSLQIGLGRYLQDYEFDPYEHTYIKPNFYQMADSLEKSQNIILILGFWQFYEESWHRFGGHAVTLTGVCKESLWVALSDPALDGAELGGQGKFFPLWHPPHPENAILHNDSIYVSHDIYISDTSLVVNDDIRWTIKDFYQKDTSLFRRFEGENFQPGQQPYRADYVPTESVYTAVEYAVMICPKPSESLCYWKPDRPHQDPPAESGMPDFDQYQFSVSDSLALCGPTAIANYLWWFGEVPQDANSPELIRLLSSYFHSEPDSGTYIDSIQAGLDSLFALYDFNLYQTIFAKPNFPEMEDSLEASQNVVLLLGFWQRLETDSGVWDWRRMGGHFVTMAGFCPDSVAFSDPARDNAESSGKGTVRPSWHPSHPGDHTYHNYPINVSHDIYKSSILRITHPDTRDTTIDTLWWIVDYYQKEDTSWFRQFEGLNFQLDQRQYFHSYVSAETIFTVAEYAIMICPKYTEVETQEEEVITPKDFELFQNQPNPFNHETIIKYNLSRSSYVSLSIYNILGQKVRSLVNEYQKAGPKTVTWDGKDEKGKDLSSGIYFYRLSVGSIGKLDELAQTKRMLLLK
jgi:hypothetical protein